MVWMLAILLFLAYFIGPHAFEITGVLAILALIGTVGLIGLGMRGMERNEI